MTSRSVFLLPLPALGSTPADGLSLLDGGVWRVSALGLLGGAALGGLLGLLFGGLLFRVLRRRGAYRMPMKGEAWIRRGFLCLALISGGLGGATLGALEGGWWSFRQAVSRGSTGDLLRTSGAFGADLMIALHQALETRPAGAPPEPGLPVAAFLRELEGLQEGLVDRVMPGLEARWPELTRRLGSRGIRAFAGLLVRKAVKDLVERPLKARDEELNLRGLRRSLVERASAQPVPGWMERGPLAAWVHERIVHPLVTSPVRAFVRGHQLFVLILLAMAWGLPLAFCAWMRKRLHERAASLDPPL